MREQLLRATLAHFESQALTARTNLEVYLQNSVGVGEHPHLVEEVVKMTQQITEAEDNVSTLEELLGQTLMAESNA